RSTASIGSHIGLIDSESLGREDRALLPWGNASPGQTQGRVRPTGRHLVVIGVLVTIGCFAVIVGGHDVFASEGMGPRLFGALLAIAGLTMLLAAGGLFKERWYFAFSLVGSFAALLVGLAMLITAWKADAGGGLLAVWWTVVIAAGVSLVLSFRDG